jgi:hypothetical protein
MHSNYSVERVAKSRAPHVGVSSGDKNMRLLFMRLLALVSVSAHASSDDVLLGSLEDVPGVYAGESNSNKVRVLFAHKSSGWMAFKSDCADSQCLTAVTSEYPKEVTWFVGLDRHQLGQVIARTPAAFSFYGHIGLQDIVGGKAPIVGKPSYEFSGFVGREVRRPLVTVSKPYFQDPALWKRIKATSEQRKRGMQLLREKEPQLCKEGPSDNEPLVPLKYGAKDLGLRLHRSKSGWEVMTINVEGAYYCQGGAGDGSFDVQTFAIDPTGKAQFLGAGLTLLDAGDYDHDGHSEIIFLLSLYNRGGYVLFSDSLTELARFEFSYH